MLEVSTLRSPREDHRAFDVGDAHHHAGFPPLPTDVDNDDFLLDYIDFSCCVDVPFFHSDDGDILPDLEVDPTDELLAEFCSSPEDGCRGAGRAADDAGFDVSAGAPDVKEEEGGVKDESSLHQGKKKEDIEEEKDVKNSGRVDEVDLSAVTTEDSAAAAAGCDDSGKSSSASASASAEGHSKKKSTGKNSHGKRKVDWTPELHRRFVQAVEQLGIDKAVPSRILELMGNQCLTRHNIASHLQKYRSHRKHLMAREAEAASWTQKRHIYAAAPPRKADAVAAAAAAGPWVVPPTFGFPPPFCRPLHVWGHPTNTADAVAAAAQAAPPLLPVWPRHLAPPPAAWAHQPPPVDHAYWQQQYNAARKWGPQAVTPGTPCVPPPMPHVAMRYPVPPVPAMMPHPMYRPMPAPSPTPPPQQGNKLAALQLQLDAHPSKESIDAAIGDVLVKPWLPLPLGLKPPSLDSVMSELHKQGIPKVPPAASGGAG